MRTTHPHLRAALIVLGAALALGWSARVAAHAGAYLPHGGALSSLVRHAAGLGAPWLAVAWLVGTLASTRARGAAGAAAALGLGTAAWYFLTVLTGGRAGAAYAVPVATRWVVVALAAGAIFGLMGATWRDGGRVARAASVATLAGALAGEALLLAGEWSGRAAQLVLTAELAVSVALLIAARRRAPLLLAVALFAVAGIAFAGIEDAVRDTLRMAGWMGP
jgi:hypothetical protein